MGLLRQKMRKMEETLKRCVSALLFSCVSTPLYIYIYSPSPSLSPSFSYTDYNGKKVPINDVLSIVFDFTSSRLEGVLGVKGASPNVQEEGGPSPRSGSKEEVEFIRKWLKQWRSEMDTEISGKRRD